MTIGPDPITRTDRISARRGMLLAFLPKRMIAEICQS